MIDTSTIYRSMEAKKYADISLEDCQAFCHVFPKYIAIILKDLIKSDRYCSGCSLEMEDVDAITIKIGNHQEEVCVDCYYDWKSKAL